MRISNQAGQADEPHSTRNIQSQLGTLLINNKTDWRIYRPSGRLQSRARLAVWKECMKHPQSQRNRDKTNGIEKPRERASFSTLDQESAPLCDLPTLTPFYDPLVHWKFETSVPEGVPTHVPMDILQMSKMYSSSIVIPSRAVIAPAESYDSDNDIADEGDQSSSTNEIERKEVSSSKGDRDVGPHFPGMQSSQSEINGDGNKEIGGSKVFHLLPPIIEVDGYLETPEDHPMPMIAASDQGSSSLERKAMDTNTMYSRNLASNSTESLRYAMSVLSLTNSSLDSAGSLVSKNSSLFKYIILDPHEEQSKETTQEGFGPTSNAEPPRPRDDVILPTISLKWRKCCKFARFEACTECGFDYNHDLARYLEEPLGRPSHTMQQDRFGNTPLHFAAAAGNSKYLHAILRATRPSEVHLLCQRNTLGETFLHVLTCPIRLFDDLSYPAHREIKQQLSINSRDYNGGMVVQRMKDAGLSEHEIPNLIDDYSNAEGVLVVAAKTMAPDFSESSLDDLIKMYDINMKDENGWTALAIVAGRGLISATKKLLGAGANPNVRGFKDGTRHRYSLLWRVTVAWNMAKAKRNEELQARLSPCIVLLVDYGAKLEPTDYDEYYTAEWRSKRETSMPSEVKRRPGPMSQ